MNGMKNIAEYRKSPLDFQSETVFFPDTEKFE